MLLSNMAVTIQNGRPEMFLGPYLSRYFTDYDNFCSVYNISNAKEFNPDIIFNFGIQYGGWNPRWLP